MSRVLLLSPAALGPKMAGPAVRFFEFARVLTGAGLEVVLAGPEPVSESFAADRGFEIVQASRAVLPELISWSEAVVVQGLALRRYPFLKRSGRPLVVDLYDPIFLETLNQESAREHHNFHLAQIIDTAAAGDFFMCASERQRDLWLGFLAAANRVNPATFDADPSLRRLIDVVPFGLPEEPPQAVGPGLRGLEGVGGDDRVVLWNGGVWDWMAPEPLVEAIDLLADELPDVKLVFMGVKHPDKGIPDSAALKRVRELIDRLELADRVILNDWVPYERRADFLCRADIGACLYPPGLETDYSFRTRLLDCLWAGLPVLCSSGDALGALAVREGAGTAVEELKPESVARALERLLRDGELLAEMGRRAARLAERFVWPRAAQALIEFCRAPHPADDKGRDYPLRPSGRLPLSYYLKRIAEHRRQGTLGAAIRAGFKVRYGR